MVFLFDTATLLWESFGGEDKELQKQEMRVLSLICSATGAKEIGAHLIKSILRNKKRNCLEQQRLNVLVFIKF